MSSNKRFNHRFNNCSPGRAVREDSIENSVENLAVDMQAIVRFLVGDVEHDDGIREDSARPTVKPTAKPLTSAGTVSVESLAVSHIYSTEAARIKLVSRIMALAYEMTELTGREPDSIFISPDLADILRVPKLQVVKLAGIDVHVSRLLDPGTVYVGYSDGLEWGE